MNVIYLDNNATTPLCPAARDAMQPHLFERFGNPASSHLFGRQARLALENAREQIADLLDAQPDEVVFTSGATEANNLALFGLAGSPPGSLVLSRIEHPCVQEPIRQLEGRGFARIDLPIGHMGVVEVLSALPADTRVAALMLANHETGAIQPVAQLAAAAAGKAFSHCDAAAAAGKMPISFRNLGISTLTISGHKFHGPQGIGALILRRGLAVRPLQFGGHQQQGRRPGTEPVALAVGMAAALDWSLRNLDAHRSAMLELRRRFLETLRAHAGPVVLNGPEEDGLPHAVNISFPGCRADALLIRLDLAGIACSTGSACSSGSLLPSPVLLAMGKSGDVLASAMRFSLSPLLTTTEVDEAARRIAQCVQHLRQKSIED